MKLAAWPQVMWFKKHLPKETADTSQMSAEPCCAPHLSTAEASYLGSPQAALRIHHQAAEVADGAQERHTGLLRLLACKSVLLPAHPIHLQGHLKLQNAHAGLKINELRGPAPRCQWSP